MVLSFMPDNSRKRIGGNREALARPTFHQASARLPPSGALVRQLVRRANNSSCQNVFFTHPRFAFPSKHVDAHSPPLRRQTPPLGCEPCRVLIEEPASINSVSQERPATEVMNKKVIRHGQLEPGPACPFGEIIVIEEPQTEPPIEPADRFLNKRVS